MNCFTYTYPTKVYFKENFSKEMLENVGDTILFAYGTGSIKKNGIYDEIMNVLKAANKKVVEFSGIMPNPTYAKVQEGAMLAQKEQVDFIIAVGGGSVIDCCKVISAQAKLEEDLYSLEYEKGQFPTKFIPIGAIVTASGTGAEMNAGAVITYEEKNWKGALFGVAPTFALLNPDYTSTVPENQVMSGAFDTLSHAMETYFGNSDADNVSDDVALAIMKNTVANMKRLIVNSQDMQARGNLMWDSAMAENGILKVGRVTDFQAHQIEHQLGAYTDCNHGQGLAVIQPIYYRHILENAKDKMTRFAKVVFDKKTAHEGLGALEQLIQDCHLPTKLHELKSKQEITKELLLEVANSTNIIQTNPRTLTHEEIYEILLECM